MKKILIPLDLNQNSCDAIDYAVKFFKHEVCDFYFLNTYSYNSNGLNALSLLQADDDWFERPKKESLMVLGRLIKKYSYKNRNEKHQFNAISECADLIDGIKKTIKELNIDILLFLGKKKNDIKITRYSKNTERIIENISECPVMVIPEKSHLQKNHEFVLVSNFETEIPIKELSSWAKLLRLVKGEGKIVVFNKVSDLTSVQKTNLGKTLSSIYNLNGTVLPVQYLGPEKDIKQFAHTHSDCILSIADRKPTIWRKLGFEHSQIVNLGPFKSTPLIALHS